MEIRARSSYECERGDVYVCARCMRVLLLSVEIALTNVSLSMCMYVFMHSLCACIIIEC